MDAKLEAVVARLEAIAAKLEGAAPAGSDSDNQSEDFPAVEAYDEVFTKKIDVMKQEAAAIDKEVEEMTDLVSKASNAVRRLIVVGQRAGKPDGDIFKYVVEATQAGIAWCDKNFRAKNVNHLKAINELMTLLTWPTIGSSAEQFVVDMTGAVECYTNKIIREFRGKDEHHVKWTQSLVSACKALPGYINDFQKGSIKFNTRAAKAKLEDLAPTGSAAPAPAPVQAAPAAAPVQAAPAKPAPAKAAGLAGKLAGLKLPVAKKEPAVTRPRDNVVQVEYFDGTDPVLSDVKNDDIVNFYMCKNCTLKVPTKVKAITILSCERVNIEPSDVIGMLELTNTKKSKVYIEGSVKIITTDKCDSIEIYLNEQSLNLKLVTSFSSTINLELPDPKEEGNYIEYMAPEQITVQFDEKRNVKYDIYTHE